MSFLTGGRRGVCIVALTLLTVFFGYYAAGVQVEDNNESMNARSDERVRVYGEFKRRFGNDEDIVVTVTRPGVLDGSGLTLIDRVTRHAAGLDGVQQVFSLTSARQLVRGSLGAEEAPLIEPPYESPDVGRRLNAALDRNAHFTGLLVGADRRTGAIVVGLEDRPEDDRYQTRIIEELRRLASETHGEGTEVHLTGIPVQKHDVASYVQRDQTVLIPLSLVVLAAVLAGFFRRLSAVVLPLLVTALSLVWTLGIYALCGFALNTITGLLPPVIMVLSVATTVHLYYGWLESDALGQGRAERIAATVRQLWFPCTFTVITDALGLISLVVSDTPAVQQFGVFGALGVMLSLVIGMAVVPIGLMFVSPPAHGGPAPGRGPVSALLRGSVALATRHPWPILAVAVGITAISAALLPTIRNDTDLLRFLRPSAPLARDSLFIDERLGGINALEFSVARRDGAALTGLDDIVALERFEREVAEIPDVSGVYGITSLLAQLQRAEIGSDALTVPKTQEDLTYAFDLLSGTTGDPLLGRLMVPDRTVTRISVRVHAIGSARAAAVIEAISALGHRVLGEGYALTATGSFYHIALDSNRIVRNQVASFGLAFSTVVVAIGLLFRSWRIALLAIPPNVFPIIWSGGVMAVAGITLNTGTAMIAGVVSGILVDDTIHYLSRFLHERAGDTVTRIVRTTNGVGRAVVIANCVLVLGFWVGAAGSFLPTVHFSLLTGMTMISGLACDLLVLPAGLIVADRLRRKPARPR